MTVDPRIRGAVQATIQLVLDEELERLVGVGPYERSDQRVDVRNGGYEQRVVTRRLENRVDELRREIIATPIPYLYLDATFIDAR